MFGDFCFEQWDREHPEAIYLLHLLSKSNDLKRTRCTQSSSIIHLWTPELTEVCPDHKVPLCFQVYYDQPVYLTLARFSIFKCWLVFHVFHVIHCWIWKIRCIIGKKWKKFCKCLVLGNYAWGTRCSQNKHPFAPQVSAYFTNTMLLGFKCKS